MENINSETALQSAIFKLENQHADEGRLLKAQFHLVFESIKPINLLKSTFEQAAASQALKGNILSTGVGIAVGYFSKILFQSVAGIPLKSIFGSALQLGVTNVVSKNPGAVKSLGAAFFRLFRRKTRVEA
jgi:hypothetical protein